MQETDCALTLDFESTGSSIAAKMAMMAITTSNSIKVKPELHGLFSRSFKAFVFAFMKPFLMLTRFKKSSCLIIRPFLATVKKSSHIGQMKPSFAKLPNPFFCLSRNSKWIILLNRI